MYHEFISELKPQPAPTPKRLHEDLMFWMNKVHIDIRMSYDRYDVRLCYYDLTGMLIAFNEQNHACFLGVSPPLLAFLPFSTWAKSLELI